MQDLLSKLEEGKWDWTKSAVEKFKAGFIRFNGEELERKRELIGVYGPTQVGKTTFILNLIGIKQELLQPFSAALRGKRRAGESATITSTVYERSNQDSFTILYPSGKVRRCHDLTELESAMGQLRSEIEDQGNYLVKPLTIQIPPDYFDPKKLAKGNRDIAVLDLPGDDTKEKKEVDHVNRVLKEYLPRCKVCILMEIAGQMTTLTQIEREFIRDWTVLPSHFRILLTRSVTSSSVQQQISHGEFSDAADFITFYKNELNRYLDGDLKNEVYPLEFGDSWIDLQWKNPILHKTASRWMTEIEDLLLADLSRIHSPEHDIVELKNLDAYVLKKSKEEVQQIEQYLTNLSKQKDEVVQLKEAIEVRLDRLKEKLSPLERINLSKLTITKAAKVTISRYEDLKSVKKTITFLSREFNYFQDQMKEFYLEEAQSVNRFVKNIGRTHGLKLPVFTYSFEETTHNLNDKYVFETYLFKKNFNQDCEYIESVLEEVNGSNYVKYTNSLTKYKSLILQEVSFLANSIMLSVDEENKLHEKQKVEIDRLEHSITQETMFLYEAKSEWDLDLARSRELNQYLKESFVKASEGFTDNLTSSALSDEEKWVYHQYWNITSSIAERIIDDDSSYNG